MHGIDDAAAALRAADYDEANRILEAQGGGKPGSAVRSRALWAIAEIMRRNFSDEAVQAIQEVGRRASSGGAAIYQRLLSVIGPLEELLPTPAVQEVRLRVGDYFLRDERPEEAMPWLAAALDAAPDDPIAIYLEANCRFAAYGERQGLRDMIAILQRAAADTPRAYYVGGQTAAFWYRLGVAFDRMKDLEEAAAYLVKAVEIDDENDTPRVLLADVLIRLHRFDDVIALLAAVPKYAEGYCNAARLRAVALFRVGRSVDALRLLQEVAELDPRAAITFLEIGQIYLARGELDQAEVALARACRTSPELAGLRNAIVALERGLGRHMDGDAGLPPATEFVIPEEFAPRPHDPRLYEEPDLRAGCAAYMRVLRTLIVRDILALYAHSGMGYFWALAQPLAYIATLATVYSVAGHRAPMGTSVIAYLAAGIVPYFSFYARVEMAVSSAVTGNVSLLYFRQVTPLVLIVAAMVREFLTALTTFVIITGGIVMFDKSVALKDPLEILIALVGISLLGSIVGIFFGLGRLAFPSLELFEVVVARTMFFFSGALYYANLIPAQMRKWALLNPLFHLIEFVRDGFFADYVSRYAVWSYPLEFIVIGIPFVLLILYSTRRYIVAQ